MILFKPHGGTYDLYPQTLRHNFRLMGASLEGKLNHNSCRNVGAEYGGINRISYNVFFKNQTYPRIFFVSIEEAGFEI